MSESKPRIKLSPELYDGQHWTYVDTPREALDAIKAWFTEFGEIDGERFDVEIVELTDQEVEALPDV